MVKNFCHDDIMQAKEKELNAWKSNNVYEECEEVSKTPITLRWILTEKRVDGNRVVKARLVARGFEENFDERCDSPTCSKEYLRLALALITANKWIVKSLDRGLSKKLSSRVAKSNGKYLWFH